MKIGETDGLILLLSKTIRYFGAATLPLTVTVLHIIKEKMIAAATLRIGTKINKQLLVVNF
jgi:hypothetical protein